MNHFHGFCQDFEFPDGKMTRLEENYLKYLLKRVRGKKKVKRCI